MAKEASRRKKSEYCDKLKDSLQPKKDNNCMQNLIWQVVPNFFGLVVYNCLLFLNQFEMISKG